jgi:hypothetical protein
MSILGIVLTLVVIVILLWAVHEYVTARWKAIAELVIVVLAIAWLVTLLFPALTTARVR